MGRPAERLQTPIARGSRWWGAVAPTAARVGVSLVGVALLSAGAVAVFVTSNSAGASTLIAVGAILLVLALFANRLEILEGGGFKLQMKAVAAKLREAERADADGDVEGAERLRRDAQLLLSAMRPMAERYERIRETLPYGWERTQVMRGIVEQARGMAGFGNFSAEDVIRLFASGGDGDRIMALGLMRGDPGLASVDLAVTVVRRPRSSFEQYEALRVCQAVAERGVSASERAMIEAAIGTARTVGSLVTGDDHSRERIVELIEAALTSRNDASAD